MTGTLKNVDQLCALSGIDARQLAERSCVDEQRVLAIMLGRWTPSPQERDAIVVPAARAGSGHQHQPDA